MTDRPDDSRPGGRRRYVPVPGLIDIDAVEDANVADLFGEDDAIEGDDETLTDAEATGAREPTTPAADPLAAPALPAETERPTPAPEPPPALAEADRQPRRGRDRGL